jgi:eukaryotic-like serine/threonine-protein kinase
MPSKLDTLPSRYRDAERIGSGGMGEIYRATDQELGRDVAVKVLAARYAQDEPFRARFKREALAAARLSGHPNIVTIFDVEEHDGRPMIVMAYMAGGSIEERAKGRAPCSPAQVLDWLEEAASALDAAHEAGIVHRDVKPANLLLDDRGHVHVADFGIASAVGMDSFTKTGTVLGTAGYLSPEQARGERATAASDRYALAIVAWELLTGRRPFEARSATEEAAAHINTPVPSLHAANPSLPQALDAVFRRALEKDPARRYPSAAEFLGALRDAMHEDAGDTWFVEPPAQRTATRVVSSGGGARRIWIPLLLVLLLAGGALAAILALTGGDHSSTPQPRTVVRTITQPGTTVQQTVTTTPRTTAPTTTAPTTTTPTTTASQAGGSGASLNNAGYAKMRAGDFAGALPLLESAVQKLNGTGSLDEAYADYNLAYTRMALGNCTDVTALLDRSESIQGKRKEIDRLRKDARRQCGGGPAKANGG